MLRFYSSFGVFYGCANFDILTDLKFEEKKQILYTGDGKQTRSRNSKLLEES